MTVSGRCVGWGAKCDCQAIRRRKDARQQRPGRETEGDADATNTKGSCYFFLLGEIVTLLSVGMPDFFNIDWTFFAVEALGFLAIGGSESRMST